MLLPSILASHNLLPNQNLNYVDVMVKDEATHIIKKASKMIKGHDFTKGNLVMHVQSELGIKINWQVIATSYGYWAIHPVIALGKGGQGEVRLAQDLITKKWAAVKILGPKLISQEQDFANEKRNLEKCNRLIGDAKDKEGNAYILMDYYSGIDLQRYLYTTNPQLSKDQPGYYTGKRSLSILFMARLVVNMMEQLILLHQKGITHRDIKLENFVFNDQNAHFDVRLVDLGTGGDLSLAQESTCRVPGTFGYNDPALMDSEIPYSLKNDLCSLGIVIAAVCSNYIYPDLLRIKLAEQRKLGQKRELTFDEIKAMMPDMFTEPAVLAAHAVESIEESTNRGLLNHIRKIVKALINEKVDERADLKALLTELKADVTRIWIESRTINPLYAALPQERSTTALTTPRAMVISPRALPEHPTESAKAENTRRVLLHDFRKFTYATSSVKSFSDPKLRKDYRAADSAHPDAKSAVSKKAPSAAIQPRTSTHQRHHSRDNPIDPDIIQVIEPLGNLSLNSADKKKFRRSMG